MLSFGFLTGHEPPSLHVTLYPDLHPSKDFVALSTLSGGAVAMFALEFV